MTDMTLEGVRIVDLGGSVAAMVATMVLAEAGADVVLVEPPGGLAWRTEPGFRTWNRSKRSVELDLADPPGRDGLFDLLRKADVLVHSHGPTAAARWGLDDDTLRRLNPGLIVSSVLGWPVNHKLADDPVDDHLVLARLGICDEQLGRRDGPIFVRFPLGTWPATWLAVTGIAARLVARQRNGVTGPAHTSLAQGALIPMMMHWSRAENPSDFLRVGMPKHDMRASLFECADGRWVHAMPPPPDDTPLMKEVFEEMGPEAVDEANRAMADQAMGNFTNWGANIAAYKRRTADEWLQNHWDHDIPAQEAAPFGVILADEQARLNRYAIEIDDPELGPITVPGQALTLDPPARVRNLAPSPGRETGEILAGWAIAGTQTERHASASAEAPLAGLKVLDFGNFLAGPLGPMLLADLGATVVKVEATTGDPMRFVDWPFAGCQRGKRSVALDLKNPAARPAVDALLRWADVVHHNLRLPAATRLGLDAASVRAVNPDVVFCHVSSYGPDGLACGLARLRPALPGFVRVGSARGRRRQPAHVASLRVHGPLVCHVVGCRDTARVVPPVPYGHGHRRGGFTPGRRGVDQCRHPRTPRRLGGAGADPRCRPDEAVSRRADPGGGRRLGCRVGPYRSRGPGAV